LRSASDSESNSILITDNPSLLVEVSFFTSVSELSCFSSGSVTSCSMSAGDAPGYTATVVKIGTGKSGSSARGIAIQLLTPSAPNMRNSSTVNCHRLTENSASVPRKFMAAPRYALRTRPVRR
jgi:hypothetical protein